MKDKSMLWFSCSMLLLAVCVCFIDFRSLSGLDRPPVTWKECYVPAKIVALTNQEGSLGEDWTTTVEFPDKTRRVWNHRWGQVGDEFKVWVRESELGIFDSDVWLTRIVTIKDGRTHRVYPSGRVIE